MPTGKGPVETIQEVKRVTKLNQKRLGRVGVLLVSLVLALVCAVSAVSASGGYKFPDHATPVQMKLDGKEVLAGETVIINSVTYVPLRSFSELMGANSITWNQKTGTATVKKGSTTIYVTDGSYYMVAADRYFYTPQPVLNISDRLFVPIRPIAKAFCVNVEWENATRTVLLKSTGKTLTPATEYYDMDDLYWLSRIISAESAGESLYGQIAVGNVVLNRVASRQFPNTVYGVIFDRNGGV